MNRSYRILPIYTADVSGVCSALYELGGMVVIHDPSGCNSTYNTHDETRWYRQDSLIFISGLSEIDAIMGNDEKFVDDIVSAAVELHPRFIALVRSPVPYLNGTDFPALARLIEARTGIPSFFVHTSGMHDYVCGAGEALADIARRFVRPSERTVSRSLNLLGVTPLDFAAPGSVETLRRIVTEQGWQTFSCWAMGDDLDALARAGEVQVNLVVSSVGLEAAKVLRERFGTPYVVGTPIGGFTEPLFAALERAAETGENAVPYLDVPQGNSGRCTTLIGEPVTMGSLAAALRLREGCPTRVLCPLERHEGLLRPEDIPVRGEEGAESALKTAEKVIADPLFRHICPQNVEFHELPHWALSGRCYQKRLNNLFTLFDEKGMREP